MKKLIFAFALASLVLACSAPSADTDGPSKKEEQKKEDPRKDEPSEATCPVSDVLLPSQVEAGGEIVISGKGFTEASVIALSSSDGSGCEIKAAKVTSSSFKGNVPEDLKSGNYKVTLKQNGDWELGSVEVVGKSGDDPDPEDPDDPDPDDPDDPDPDEPDEPGENPYTAGTRTISSVKVTSGSATRTVSIEWGTEGFLVYDDDDLWFEYSVTSGGYEAVFRNTSLPESKWAAADSYAYTLSGGRIEADIRTIGSREKAWGWFYNEDGCLETVKRTDVESSSKDEFYWSDGRLVGMNGNEDVFVYGKWMYANPSNVDIALTINELVGYIPLDETYLFASWAGIGGAGSLSLPTAANDGSSTTDIEYEQDSDGYVLKATISGTVLEFEYK